MSYAIFNTEQAKTDWIASVNTSLGYPKTSSKVGGGHRLTITASARTLGVYGSTANKWAVKLDRETIDLVPAGVQVKNRLPSNFAPIPESP